MGIFIMIQDKKFYQELPKINGYKWVGFDDGFHIFTKVVFMGIGTLPQWYTCKLTEDDISDTTSMEYMLNNNLTRVSK